MNFLRFFAVLLALTMMLSTSAQAERKSGVFSWMYVAPDPEGHTRPYIEDAKAPHAYLWHQGDWSPQTWIRARGSVEGILDDLYGGGIITEQSSEEGIPVLEVGQNFLMLANQDRLRVVEFLDYAYGITERVENGAIYIDHKETGRRIGLYTERGLQLQ